MGTGDPRPWCCSCNCHGTAFHSTSANWYVPQPLSVAPKSDAEQLDDFAEAALQGLIASFSDKDREEWRVKLKMSNERIAQQFAHDAYEIAQAMMNRRAAIAAQHGKEPKP